MAASREQTIPLSVLLKRELAHEKIENPEIVHGQAGQSKKGEDLTLVKAECQRMVGDGVSTYSVFGMFDGHNGSAAAIYTKENLLNNVLSAIPPDLNRNEWVAALPRALVAGFVKTDKDFQEKGQKSGTTVTFVIIEGWVVTVASVGDSRCVLESSDGEIYYLSADHRLDTNEEERVRITSSGGEVGRLNTGGGAEVGPLRCWPGGLCLSRSIGDMDVGAMDSEAAPQLEEIKQEGVGGGTKKKKKSKKSSFFPRFGCFRIEHDVSGGGFDIEVVDESGQRPTPTHLIIMVNGLVGSAQNWKFAAKQLLKRFPEDAVVHCSERNSSMLTFDGVDVMGDRLAEEVISVIKRHPSVQKISFVGHSLGGLIARYAIARLYGRDISLELSVGNGHCESHVSDQECHDRKYEGKIAGLEPINFITSATPHLGSRGHKQVPMFCGFYSLEKAVSRVAGVFGKTGKHLFLTDSDNGKPPLLLQMVRDSEDIKFLSALRSFKRRIAYANVRYDQLVGWSTSSLRRRKELPKRRHLSRHEKYPHIVNVETAKSSCVAEEVPAESKLSSESSKLDSEEEMIRSLTAMSWDRIDVSFSGSRQKYLAHSTIQVNTYCINSDGADVIQHMVDSFQI